MTENNLWLERWKNRELGFHQTEVNPFLIAYFSQLNLSKGAKVFVPLCGKSIDIAWLLDEGYEVRGIELSEDAIVELFEDLDLVPSISTIGELQCYKSENISIFVGDIFALSQEILGTVEAIYDRASLVALKQDIRLLYTKHLTKITNQAPQLLLCFEYEQSLMNRSPYSVDEEEVKGHYCHDYRVQLLSKEEIVGGFKGKIPASDVVWLLTN